VLVAVAFGLRPYIGETEAALLLKPDPAVQEAAAVRQHIARVYLELPFASPPRTVTWADASGKGLLQQEEPWQVCVS
jgi:hypothetical protein